jgi:hypothetical protein
VTGRASGKVNLTTKRTKHTKGLALVLVILVVKALFPASPAA